MFSRHILGALDRTDKYNNHDMTDNNSSAMCFELELELELEHVSQWLSQFSSLRSLLPLSLVSTELYLCWVHRKMMHYGYVVCARNCACLSDWKNWIYRTEIKKRENRNDNRNDILTWSDGDGEMKEWIQNEMKRNIGACRVAGGDICDCCSSRLSTIFLCFYLLLSFSSHRCRWCKLI